MDRNLLNKRGFSLAELSLVLIISAVLIALASYSAGRIRQVALAQRALEELSAIALASARYYAECGTWPVDTADLRPKYLGAQAQGANPFGNVYLISSQGSRVSVSTVLPTGLVTNKNSGSELVIVNQGSNDLITISNSYATRTWKLKYDKKYIYHQ